MMQTQDELWRITFGETVLQKVVTVKTGFRFCAWLLCYLPSSCLTLFATTEKASIWQWPPNRSYHVENYRLALRFNEQQGQIFGDEVITLRPLGANFRKFYLDCSELKIESATLEPALSKRKAVTYVTQDSRRWITLDHDYDQRSTLHIHIIYQGFPRKGLYFVNPTSDYPNAPQEVYSQGEADFNHYWFPCWDYPNDMATRKLSQPFRKDRSSYRMGSWSP
jgi:aminopeptidase N